MVQQQVVNDLAQQWKLDERWKGIERLYSPEDVLRLRGSIRIEYTLARMGAERLWRLMKTEPYVAALGALTGNQAVQQVAAGLKAIYVSGWQVAADANNAGAMYPDQSLYPSDGVRSEEHTSELQSRPHLVCRLLLEKKKTKKSKNSKEDN